MVGASLGIGLAVLAAVALAVQSLSVKASTKRQPVTQVIVIVYLVNLLVMVPLAIALYYPNFGLTPVSLASFAVGGILGSLLARICLFVGIERLGASRAEPLKSTFPLVAVLAAVVTLDEKLTTTLVVGIVLLVGGAAAVSWDARTSHTGAGRHAWRDIGFPFAAALLLGIDPVFTKVGFAEGTPAFVGVTVRVLAAAIGFGAYLFWHRLRVDDLGQTVVSRWTVVAGVSNTMYLCAYLAALARSPVSVVTPVLGASPLFVLVASAVFVRRDERVTIRLGVAVTVLVAGVVLVLRG